MAKMEDAEKRLCLAMEKEAEKAINALKGKEPNIRLAVKMLERMAKQGGLDRFILLHREAKELPKKRRYQIMDAMANLLVKIEGDINEALALITRKEYEGATAKIKVIISEIIQELGWESQLEKTE